MEKRKRNGPERPARRAELTGADDAYGAILSGVVGFIAAARRAAARSVNAVMTATYWLIGSAIVEGEQGGAARAAYGEALLDRLSADLTARFGRGFSVRNLRLMRQFYASHPIRQTLSANSKPPGARAQIRQTLSAESIAARFPLPWSHYVSLLGVRNEHARAFYEA